MSLELKQNLKLSQQLVMTPQLQQAIKLLQLSRIELCDMIRNEINENPILDETMEQDKPQQDISQDGLPETDVNSGNNSEPEAEFDWSQYVDTSRPAAQSNYAGSGDQEQLEPIITNMVSFTDHLLWQLHLTRLSELETEIGEYIIGNINKDGYLLVKAEEIAEEFSVEPDIIEDILKKINRLDPVGVAARNLQECLLIQAEVFFEGNQLIRDIIINHMKDLERKRYTDISRALKVSVKEVVAACDIITDMDPRPGRAFNENEPQYITPDIYVYKIDGEYVVVLNEDGQPKLKINSFYRNILTDSLPTTDKTRDYIQDKFRSAVWLIKSLYHRQNTIVNVMKSIIKFQKDFFDYGCEYLKPMVLRDVAEDIGMHESNISRVTTNKYVYTPHGIFELKYFFNSGLLSDNGGSIASESVKNMIREIIQKEDHNKPYSDIELVKILKGKGVNIARRTVAKYREMLGILASSRRKNHL